MNRPLFILSHEDWSLHRKGELDQERHKQKVREAIKNNLADLVSEESIILPQGGKVVKVPIRSLDEPKFRYNHDNQQRVGQGSGGSQPGDVIGRASPDPDGKGSGPPGDQAGVDYYEADITIDELAELLFEDLELPRLKPRSSPDLTVEDIRFNDIRKRGMMGNVDKRRTLMQALKRQALSGSAFADCGGPAERAEQPAGFGTITNEDLRFKTWEDIEKPQSAAVVIAMMDTSGSMGTFEKYIARSFYFWMVRFLRTKYEKVVIRFLAHHTEAKEVDEESFFSKGESGGTKCSSVYELALDIVNREYPSQQYNVYGYHFSDGDNLDADNALTVKLALELTERINMLGYGEIRQRYQIDRRLWESMATIQSEAFVHSVLREKSDVYRTLKAFFGDSAAG